MSLLSRSTEETGRFEPKSTTQRQANTMMFSFYFVKQNNGDRAENVVGDRQDRETGTGDRRTRIQRDKAGNVVGDMQDRETGNRRQANCWRDLHEPNSEDNLAPGEQCSANL